MNQENKAKWNHNVTPLTIDGMIDSLKGVNPSQLTENKTLLEHILLLEEAIKGIPEGPQGPQGPQGDRGPEGPQGPKGADGTGAGNTTIYVNGVVSERQDITDDLQSQFDYVEGEVGTIDGELAKVKTSVSGNIEGIAHLNEIKQDKLAQVDLDNIASIDQMKRDINAKANKVQVNNTYIGVRSATKDNNVMPTLGSGFIAPSNGYFYFVLKSTQSLSTDSVPYFDYNVNGIGVVGKYPLQKYFDNYATITIQMGKGDSISLQNKKDDTMSVYDSVFTYSKEI